MIWHYTKWDYIAGILKSGVIRKSTIKCENGKWQAVWFSTNQYWERTARRDRAFDPRTMELLRMTPARHWEIGCPLYRIGVDEGVAPYTFNQYCRRVDLPKKDRSHLLRKGESWGADHKEWRCSLSPVPSDKWVAIERYEADGWTPYEAATATAMREGFSTVRSGKYEFTLPPVVAA
jgi:hypothetical protein